MQQLSTDIPLPDSEETKFVSGNSAAKPPV